MKKILFVFLLVNIVFLTGCHPLRNKFIRKEKPKKISSVYVDFKDYSETLSKEDYLDYYLFVQGWLDELIQALDPSGNRKKQKQAISEAIVNFEQMIYFFNEEGREEVSSLYEEFLKVKKEVNSSYLNEQKKDSLRTKVDFIKREFQRKLRWSNASLWMD